MADTLPLADDLLSLAEAADLLSVSEITVKRYIYAGRLKSHKLPGGRHRIPRAELTRLLEGGAPPPAPEEIVTGLETRVEELEAALEHVSAEVQVLAAWCARREDEARPTGMPTPAPRRIEILGPDCRKCRKLHETVLQVVAETCPTEFVIAMVSDLNHITEYGPVLTPGLVLDGRLISSGRVLNAREVAQLLQAAH